MIETHINLLDLLESARVGEQVEIFPNEEQLRLYTIENGRYFPKEEAYEGGILKYLLREIHNEYHGKRGKNSKKRRNKKKKKKQ